MDVDKEVDKLDKKYRKKLIFLPPGNGFTLFGTATEALAYCYYLDLLLDVKKLLKKRKGR